MSIQQPNINFLIQNPQDPKNPQFKVGLSGHVKSIYPLNDRATGQIKVINGQYGPRNKYTVYLGDDFGGSIRYELWVNVGEIPDVKPGMKFSIQEAFAYIDSYDNKPMLKGKKFQAFAGHQASIPVQQVAPQQTWGQPTTQPAKDTFPLWEELFNYLCNNQFVDPRFNTDQKVQGLLDQIYQGRE